METLANLPVQVFGIVWYERKHYHTLRKRFPDGRRLPPTYDQWLKKANRGLANLEREGKTCVKAYIHPERFPAWCAARGLDIDAHGRDVWANHVARRFMDGDDGFDH